MCFRRLFDFLFGFRLSRVERRLLKEEECKAFKSKALELAKVRGEQKARDRYGY